MSGLHILLHSILQIWNKIHKATINVAILAITIVGCKDQLAWLTYQGTNNHAAVLETWL